MLLAPVATLRSASSATAQEAQEPEEVDEVEEVEELEEPPTSLSQEEQDALKKEDHACQIMSAPKLSCCRLVLPRRHSGTWLRPHYVNEMYDKTQQINKPMPRFRTKCKSLTTYWRSKLLTLGSDLEFSLWTDARVPPQHVAILRTAAIHEFPVRLPVRIWSSWENKAGRDRSEKHMMHLSDVALLVRQDLITLSQERGSGPQLLHRHDVMMSSCNVCPPKIHAL